MKDKILGIIKYNGDTTEKLIEYLNISLSSFYNKLNNRNEFTRTEILKFKERYNLSPEQIDEIFFG